MKEIKKVVVHGGVFHADDGMVAAMAKIIAPEAIIERTFKVPSDISDDTIIADIGGGRYDHHQKGAEERANGHRYAACGLFFRDFWQGLFQDEEAARVFEEEYILPIEDADNGVVTNPLSLAVSSFVPAWDSEESMDEAFVRAVAFLTSIVENEVRKAAAAARAKRVVEEAVKDMEDGVVCLPVYCPWQSVLVPSKASFVIYPSQRGGYSLQVVPAEIGKFAAKQDLPESWLNQKPEGCTFVHLQRFLAAFDSKEQAKAAALSIIKK